MEHVTLLLWALAGLAVTLTVIPIILRRTTSSTAGAAAFHHTHKTPVSRLGGVALAAAFVVVTAAAFIWFPAETGVLTRRRVVIVCSSLAIFLLGLWDDFRPLGARKKLIGQVLVALCVCYFDVRIDKFMSPLTVGFLNVHSGEVYELGWIGWVVTVLWLVALTNMINLIDGIDGLAGGIGLMMMGLLVYVGVGMSAVYPLLVAAGMFGALLGFLRYNFPPAKIYLGDCGAYFIGFLIAILTLVNSQKGTILAALVAPLFALALPIVDVAIAIVRRGLRGLPLFRPDRRHIHHRLQDVGLSRTRTVLLLYGISSVFLLMAFGVFWSQGRWVPILFGFLCLTLLLSARSFNFSRDWFAVGRVLENSLEMRKETHYALALARWLEMEAERADSVESLWEDFRFVCRKLRFTRVRLVLEDGERVWEGGEGTLSRKHVFGTGRGMSVEFTGDAREMTPRVFEHLCELAAEAWLNATNKWVESNETQVRFDAKAK